MSANEIEMIDRIADAEYEKPSSLDADTLDLFSKIFKVNPLSRLGAGPPGSENSIEALKSHPFFGGENFDEVHLKTPPLDTLGDKFKVEKYWVLR